MRFGPQATRGGARRMRGDPIATHPTTRVRFQCTHPRRRAWPGGRARSLLASLRGQTTAQGSAFRRERRRAHRLTHNRSGSKFGLWVPLCPGDESGTVAPPPYFAKRPLTCSMLCHHIMSSKPLSEPFLIFGPQATRGGARHEGGDPLAPCPTTRGRFHRAHPRGRA